MNKSDGQLAGCGVICIALLCVGGCWGYPNYRVWQRDLAGQAELAEAEWTKKIAIAEAGAKLESAEMLADSEIARARGVAEANKIIGDSLKDNEAYLRYLWVQGLHDGSSEVIYIPTEAGMPILEASRLTPAPAEN